ncbi:cupin domain-containing protein [Leisingera aquimarina]|uniref:cupin domain-containing protein n=1 Tax=Leisingera aquimarina TaxID=476529 RepID=UPI00040D8956|nr:cupin domain-containing protein [Leisingera aquimarina]
MTDPRYATGPHFTRRSATDAVLTQLPGWDLWECNEPVFFHTYDQTVTLHVNRGAASLSFSDGSEVELQPGDVLTILKGISADWTIPAGIQNSYQSHSDGQETP